MKKLGLIGLILIVALSSVGFGYGSFSQNLNIGAPVSTGSFDVVFDSFTAPTSSYGAAFSVYQVNSHTCEISLSDLYPSLDGMFNFTLKDTGTIPAKITDIKIDGASLLTKNKDLDGDGKTDITLTVSGISNTTTIAAAGTVSGSLTVHTWSLSADGNDATANAGGSFTLEIDTAQRY